MRQDLQKVKELLSRNGNPDTAIRILHSLLKREGDSHSLYHYLGVGFLKKREYRSSIGLLNRAVELGSERPETFHSLAVCHGCFGDYGQAEIYARRAIELRPDYLEGWMQLGVICRSQGRLNEALVCYQKANGLDPANAEVAVRIGSVYSDQGNHEKALELFEIAVKVDRQYQEAWVVRGEALEKLGRKEEAEASYRELIGQDPKLLLPRLRLAEMARNRGEWDKVAGQYQELIGEFPGQAALRSNHALLNTQLGRFDEAEREYLKAMEMDPSNPKILSAYLMSLHYNPARTQKEIFEAHRLWEERFMPDKRPPRPAPADRRRDKKLRIGLLSGGFWSHPVGWMITAGLEHLPREGFELVGYSTNTRADHLTRRLQEACVEWKSVVGYRDEVIAGLIRNDSVDILVELSGHSADNRLRTVALEPAPIIIKWVGGLFNTTGLSQIDYLISDRYETPEGSDQWYGEHLIRMPDDYICYLPPEYAPEVSPLPAMSRGHVTFGCFNNPSKINDVILDQWGEILRQVPDSRLLLKGKPYESEEFRGRIARRLARFGVEESRLTMEGQSPHRDLLESYGRVDIALDPWPYSGGLTTCEALWMGVPVVTRPGPTFAGRHSTTHLINAGYGEWVCPDWESYRECAVKLASDIGNLSEIRSRMRGQVSSSPLCDGIRFGRHLGLALREVWNQWAEGVESGSKDWRKPVDVSKLLPEEAEDVRESVNGHQGGETQSDGVRQPARTPQQGLNGRSEQNSQQENAGADWQKVLESMLLHARPLNTRHHDTPGGLIVSLTSYPKRFATLHLTLLSLLNQTVRPDKVILWIAHGDREKLGSSVTSLRPRGLEIRYCDDLLSFKKIIPALESYPDACIVTADDDVYYWPTWLEELVMAWKESPECVVAHRAHRVQISPGREIQPYSLWGMGQAAGSGPSPFHFQTGIGGVLYPPGIFIDEVLNREAFMELCPHGDDIWLWWMVRLNGVDIRVTGTGRNLITWPETQQGALWRENLAGGRNDRQIRRMMERYGNPLRDVADEGNPLLDTADESPVTGQDAVPSATIAIRDSDGSEAVTLAAALAGDLKNGELANERRRWSLAQGIRRELTRALAGSPQNSRLKPQGVLDSFNRVSGSSCRSLSELFGHRFGFGAGRELLELPMRGAVGLCRPAQQLVALTDGLNWKGLRAIVHGSMADGRHTPFSDVDITLFVDPEVLLDNRQRADAAETIERINRAIAAVDPIGHHGVFVHPSSDLTEWPEASMPLEVLSGGFLLNLEPFSCEVAARPSSDLAFLTLEELCGYFIRLPGRMGRQDGRTIKNLISRYFIINLLHYELRFDRFAGKRTILEGGLDDIAGENQRWCLERLTRIRSRWPEQRENRSGFLASEVVHRCAAAAVEILEDLDKNDIFDRVRTEWIEEG